MEKRYQVFVSSTYEDLQDERKEVMQALLECGCIPAGMELFPAADDDQWTLIKRVIDESDYYMVILAGRYGSLGSDGVGYTEMEYRYALETGKPIIGFVHSNPGSIPSERCDDGEKKAKLHEFQDLVKKKVCKFWDSPTDLGGKVSRSINHLIRNTPGIGWVRGDEVSAIVDQEMLKLRKKIDSLENQIALSSQSAPEGSEALEQGEDDTALQYSFRVTRRDTSYRTERMTAEAIATWNAIFLTIAPMMIIEASEARIHEELAKLTLTHLAQQLNSKEFKNWELSQTPKIAVESFNKVKIQLRALGLIMPSAKTHSVKDNGVYWSLTPYGDMLMTKLMAITRDV